MLALNQSPWTYRIGIPVFHLAALAGFFSPLPEARALALYALLYAIRGMGITVGYHRYFTHESFRAGRALAFVLAFFGGLAGQGTASWWIYRHRMHHRYTDREGDPHSPRVAGFWYAHVGWLFARRTAEARAGEDALRAGWPLELRALDHAMPLLFLAQGAFLYAIGGWSALAWGYFVPIVISWHLTFLVNSLCHVAGDRPFDTSDDSRNNLLFGALTFGEGWHNNHHAWPKNARLGLRPYQLDFGFAFVRALAALGWVWDVTEKSEAEIRASVRRYDRAG